MPGKRRRTPKHYGNPSGRKFDFLQSGGIKKALKLLWIKHWRPLEDIFARMGIIPIVLGGTCHFCKHRYATFYLSPRQSDPLAELINHILHHENHNRRARIHKHPFDHLCHLLSSMISCYLTKGNYPYYELCRTMIRHNTWEALHLLDGDWHCAMNYLDRTHSPKSLESFASRTLLRPFIYDLLFEFAAYLDWYLVWRTYKIAKKANNIPEHPIDCMKGDYAVMDMMDGNYQKALRRNHVNPPTAFAG